MATYSISGGEYVWYLLKDGAAVEKYYSRREAERSIQRREKTTHWKRVKQQRRVECLETGVVYSSASEAANAVNRKREGIYRAVLKGKMCAGCHWRYVNETV